MANIRATLLRLLADRGTATACPSEIARALSPEDWRALMPRVREEAALLQDEGLVDVYQRGRPVRLREARGPLRLRLRGAAETDYRKHPERYRVGRGEEGVLTVQPYKSELLPLWRFRTVESARASAAALWSRFEEYAAAGDFVGMDMARKYLQMGWTRARRYANHRSGRKYANDTRAVLPAQPDTDKARSAGIFREVLDRALAHPGYLRQLEARSRGERDARPPVSNARSGTGGDATRMGRARRRRPAR